MSRYQSLSRDQSRWADHTVVEVPTPCVREPELWFAESPVRLEQAKHLCGGCPLRVGCLAGAMERREPWGVWGGEIFQDGVVVASKRGRGRPRKERPAA